MIDWEGEYCLTPTLWHERLTSFVKVLVGNSFEKGEDVKRFFVINSGIKVDFKISLADVVLVELLSKLSKFSTLCDDPDLLHQYPTLAAHHERVKKLSQPKAYVEEQGECFDVA